MVLDLKVASHDSCLRSLFCLQGLHGPSGLPACCLCPCEAIILASGLPPFLPLCPELAPAGCCFISKFLIRLAT